jgi:hypothetical protein
LLHLFLWVLAWLGLLTPTFYADPSLLTLWESTREIFGPGSTFTVKVQALPWGFRGIEPMHGNIGYAASQTIALSCACLCMAWHKQDRKTMVYAALLTIACFASVVIATSRGAVYFGLLIMAASFFLYFFVRRPKKDGVDASSHGSQKSFLVLVVLVFVCLTAWVVDIARKDIRWYSMLDKVEVGLSIQDPIRTLCNGLSAQDVTSIRQHYAERDSAYVQELIAGLEGQDGGRILLMRAGAQLVLEYPRGLDGSRQSYQKLIEKKCEHPPQLAFAHAHQAWINLSLALGWVGALLFASVLITFAVKGWRGTKTKNAWPWGMALMVLALFWIFRGMADAVYQEHYLQAFFLLYLFMQFLIHTEKPV